MDPTLPQPPRFDFDAFRRTYLTFGVLFPCILIASFIAFLFLELAWPPIRDRIAFWDAEEGYVNAEPIKNRIQAHAFTFKGQFGWPLYTTKHLYTIHPVADYTVEGRVLHTRHYHSDKNSADLIPFDMGLGWGLMSDLYAVKNYFLFHHSNFGGRVLWIEPRVSFDEMPMDYYSEGETGLHFSNNHLIPANQEIYEKLKQMRTGDIVRLKGQLVNVTRPDLDRWEWKTSTYERNDPRKNKYWGQADAATCDTIFVTEAELVTSLAKH